MPIRPRTRFISYDPFFERVKALGLRDRMPIWIPFEGSRGCWYGQKVQCTFCGLHEIMKFRERNAAEVVGELAYFNARYGETKFFAVDLILPRTFFDTFLPQLSGLGRDWRIFYEVKANLRRDDVSALADAGVKWIQPGIESLDDEVLRLMRKGVSAIQNITLLRMCREYGIEVTWNIIGGLPGESLASYRRMRSKERAISLAVRSCFMPPTPWRRPEPMLIGLVPGVSTSSKTESSLVANSPSCPMLLGMPSSQSSRPRRLAQSSGEPPRSAIPRSLKRDRKKPGGVDGNSPFMVRSRVRLV
jgi:radical SAM superfamily enzyme YgiQ (UPF0313 family)